MKNWKFEKDMWYISNDEPRIYGKIDVGLQFSSKRDFSFYETEGEWEEELINLGIDNDENVDEI